MHDRKHSKGISHDTANLILSQSWQNLIIYDFVAWHKQWCSGMHISLALGLVLVSVQLRKPLLLSPGKVTAAW